MEAKMRKSDNNDLHYLHYESSNTFQNNKAEGQSFINVDMMENTYLEHYISIQVFLLLMVNV